MEDSVADRAQRPKPFFPLKNILLLLLVAFGATMDRTKALIITGVYFLLAAIFA